ncbi:hypothetical protein LINPERPRIM_LOCUS24290 [Linum perenne]
MERKLESQILPLLSVLSFGSSPIRRSSISPFSSSSTCFRVSAFIWSDDNLAMSTNEDPESQNTLDTGLDRTFSNGATRKFTGHCACARSP